MTSKQRTIRRWALIVAAGCVAAAAPLLLGDFEVDGKRGKTELNDDIDQAGSEEVAPADEVKLDNGNVVLTSVTFKPPQRPTMRFIEYDKELVLPDGTRKKTHVDIREDPDSLPKERLTDTSSRIQVRGVFAPVNAANFPLRSEGNLRRDAGGGGVPTLFWAAKIAEKTCKAEKEYSRGNDDNFECQYESAEIKVTVFAAVNPPNAATLSFEYAATITGRPGEAQATGIARATGLVEEGTTNSTMFNVVERAPAGSPGDEASATLKLRQTVPLDNKEHKGKVLVVTGGTFTQQEFEWTFHFKADGTPVKCEVTGLQHPVRVLPLVNAAGAATGSYLSVPFRSSASPYPDWPGEARFSPPDPDGTWRAGTRCIHNAADVRALLIASGLAPAAGDAVLVAALLGRDRGRGIRTYTTRPAPGGGSFVVPGEVPVASEDPATVAPASILRGVDIQADRP